MVEWGAGGSSGMESASAVGLTSADLGRVDDAASSPRVLRLPLGYGFFYEMESMNWSSLKKVFCWVTIALTWIGNAHGEVATPGAPVVTRRFLAEMERIPELEWPSDSALARPQDLSRVTEDWAKCFRSLEEKLTAEMVIGLSRWAKAQMQTYARVPRLAHPDLHFVAVSPSGQEAIFEATLEVLPSHSPLVTRWLKLFLIYDRVNSRLSTVIVTIRGERQE